MLQPATQEIFSDSSEFPSSSDVEHDIAINRKSFPLYKMGFVNDGDFIESEIELEQEEKIYSPAESINFNQSCSDANTIRYVHQSNSPKTIIYDNQESGTFVKFATRPKLIELLTTTLDYSLLEDFLLTFEMIMNADQLANLLMSRLFQAFDCEEATTELDKELVSKDLIKMRTLIVLQGWIQMDKGEKLNGEIKEIILKGFDRIWYETSSLSQPEKTILLKIRKIIDPNLDENIDPIDPQEAENNKAVWTRVVREKFKRIFSLDPASINEKQPEAGEQSFESLNARFNNLKVTRPILIRVRSKRLVRILERVEFELFIRIQRSELVIFPEVSGSSDDLVTKCPNIQELVTHFNGMCKWFVRLLEQPSAEEKDSHFLSHNQQLAILAKLIRLAVKSILFNNFATALQIIIALQSPQLTSQKRIWDDLGEYERNLYSELLIFGSPERNFRNVRRAMDRCILQKEFCVPFSGLFLADMVHNSERIDENLNASGHSNPFYNKLVPFYKNRGAARIIRNFLDFKKIPIGSNFTSEDRELYAYFKGIKKLYNEMTSSFKYF